MRILALDQASITGWALYEDNQLIDYGLIDKSNIHNPIVRIVKIKEEIEKIIKYQQVSMVGLEDVYYGRRNSTLTYKFLCELLGTLQSYLYEQQIPFTIVRPAQWRHTCQIKKSNKKQMKADAQLFVKQNLGLDVDADIADAICLGWHVATQCREGQQLATSSTSK